MNAILQQTRPFDDQKPGTSGLRKKVARFQLPNYLENFVQSVFDAISPTRGKSLVVGGDGRYFNREALQIIIRMAAANDFSKLIVGQGGLLSTPAASCLIRKYSTDGGLILSASHNPAGPDGDFGIKFNGANGGPATEQVTNSIYEHTLTIERFFTCEAEPVNLDQLGETRVGEMEIVVLDPVSDYAGLMAAQFDLEKIGALLRRSDFRLCFDAMHAVTGPYAKYIFEDLLGAADGSVINSTPLKDFGGGHPDPNQHYASDLVAAMNGDDPADFGAASDGDGDRNMVMGKGFYINPCDSLAVLAANAHHVPAFAGGIPGVARSMPTSRAVDHVAKVLDIPLYETPTGWKFFGNLMDGGQIALCGEESFGTGSSHIREKDGIWVVLYWLNLIAVFELPAEGIMLNHWRRFGRDFFTRHDYEALDHEIADRLMSQLQQKLPLLENRGFQGQDIVLADQFAYEDPVDGSWSRNQGIRVQFANGSRLVFRLSGTGTQDATLRIYIDRHEPDTQLHSSNTQRALADQIRIARELAQIEFLTGRGAPHVIT